MKIFFTSASRHLAPPMALSQGSFSVEKFADGELQVVVHDNVTDQQVYVVGSTQAPAEHIIELLLLVETLKQARAHVHLIIPYFGYARQDMLKNNVSCGAYLVSKLLEALSVPKISIIHAHSSYLKEFLTFHSCIPYELFVPLLKNVDVVVAPDKGSKEFATKLALIGKKEVIFIEKERTVDGVMFSGIPNLNLMGKSSMIVDDMISSGQTMIECARFLKQHNAGQISALATHALFTGSAIDTIEQTHDISRVFVTTTLPQKNSSQKIICIEIGEWIEGIVKKNIF